MYIVNRVKVEIRPTGNFRIINRIEMYQSFEKVTFVCLTCPRHDEAKRTSGSIEMGKCVVVVVFVPVCL